MEKQKIKKPFYKKWWFIAIIVIGIIGAFGTDGEDDNKKSDKPSVNKEAKGKKKEAEEKVKQDLKLTGDINVEFKDNKAITSIKTNAIDDSLFEVVIMDSEFNIVSDFIAVKDGKAIKEFEVNENWKTGYLAATAGMRFNYEDHLQPEHIRKVYGEYGENIEGDLTQENNKGGKNMTFETKTVGYPDEDTAISKQAELFSSAMNELIEASEGVIVSIKPRFEKGDWSAVTVNISDAWYNSQEHEKERFAEQIGTTISSLVKNSGSVDSSKTVMVYLHDIYDKELASPKVMGGYKIKR